MKFIIDREKYIDTGLVNEQSHPTLPLVIYNYSQKCQFSKAWDEVTLMCRGLIVHKDTREIVARPFKKFFNYEEHIQNGLAFPSEAPLVYKKMDGSLGILYWYEGVPYIATRGSFASEQAIWATDWFRKNLWWLYVDTRCTYLFEIVASWNRIVVNYRYEGLVLLAMTDNETGKTINLQEHFRQVSPWPTSDEQRKQLYPTLKRVGTMPKVSKSIIEKGQGEVSQKEVRDHSELASTKSKESIRISSDSISESSSGNNKTERCFVCGLQKEISTLCNGLRPCEGSETSECRPSQVNEENTQGSKEVSGCMCELPSNQDLEKFMMVEQVPYASYTELKSLNTKNEEGFVVHFPMADMRLKIKFDDYVKLHKVMTGLSEIGIWEMLKEGKDPITPEIPDEMHGWISSVMSRLRSLFAEIWGDAQIAVQMVAGKQSRKEQAMYIMENHKAISGIVFGLLDKKEAEAAQSVWRMIRPKGARTFKKDLDA